MMTHPWQNYLADLADVVAAARASRHYHIADAAAAAIRSHGWGIRIQMGPKYCWVSDRLALWSYLANA